MYQDEYRDSRTTKSTETLFSVVPVGTCTYRHMSDDDVFHMNINTLEKGLVSREYPVFEASKGNNLEFLVQHINSSEEFKAFCAEQKKGGTRTRLYYNTLCQFTVRVPALKEQAQISQCLKKLDTLITLHQRKLEKLVQIRKAFAERCFLQSRKEFVMAFTKEADFEEAVVKLLIERGWKDGVLKNYTEQQLIQNWANILFENNLFCDYYEQWVAVYKEGAVRPVTLDKYKMTLSWVKRLAPDLKLCEVSRVTYQQLLNDYAVGHERQTTMDFHHQLKGAIMDAVDDGLIVKDPTRKAIIKGKPPVPKKVKYLNQFELHLLLSDLDLQGKLNWDWMILLIAKTGIRFSEALAITPADFDFSHQMLSINKTWDYKGNGGFLPTKNKSSVRKIQIDWQTVIQFAALVKDVPEDKPIFVFKEHAYNSTVNDVLERHCNRAKIPVISVHGLRHTHASVLLFAGVSIASVARRLGHSSMTTTQKTYLHIIQELENQDIDLVMRSLSGLS